MKIENENVKKEKKRLVRNIVISVILIIASIGCKYLEDKTIEEANKNIKDLNTIITDKKENKEDKKSYINAKSIPYKFAVYDDTTDSYYIISDGRYLYIAYMSVSDYNKLNKDTIYNKPIKIEGITKQTTKDIKQLAIDAYNKSLENESEKITLADFENYFGSVYLNMTIGDQQVALLPFILFLLFLIFGVILLIASLYEQIKYNKEIKKMDDAQINELNREMNNKDAFYYEKAHLYLTENYIINFGGGFKAIKYEDILWMYPFIQRTNGIKTSQSIKVLTKEGKNITIATIDVVTKTKKEIYEEIWNTIIEKNQRMLVGYTKENIQKMNEKIKEIKKQKRNLG